MASADQMERERRRLALLELATQRADAQQEYQNSLMEERRIGSFSEGTPRPPEPNRGFMDNLKGLGSMIGDTALSLVPGTQQSEDLSYLLQTSPEDIPLGVLKSFASTGSNVADLLPYIDTGVQGNNYAAAYRSGEGLSMGLEDILNLLAVGAAGKAVNAGATARMGVTPTELFASRLGIAPAIAAEASVPSRLNAIYEFMRNPDRLEAINNLPLPDLSTAPPTFTVKGKDMMSLLDEGYKSKYNEGGMSSMEGIYPDYDSVRASAELDKFAGQQPKYGFASGDDFSPYDMRQRYGGSSATVNPGTPLEYNAFDPLNLWEVDTRLNRPMTVTPGDSFDVGSMDVRPYDRMSLDNAERIKERLNNERFMGENSLNYNEVQVYGDAPISPDDLMSFTLNTVDGQALLRAGRTPEIVLQGLSENIPIAKRLIDEGRSFTIKIRESGSRGTQEVIKTLEGQEALDYLIRQQRVMKSIVGPYRRQVMRESLYDEGSL